MSTNSTALQHALGKVRFTHRDLIRINRPILFALFYICIGLIGAFRAFGGDKEGPGGAHELYPFVANGWGVWYWLAQLHFTFHVFFFIVTIALAVQMMPLAFPRRRQPGSWPVSFVLMLYVTLWFLFLQLRYGTALVMLAPVAVFGGIPLLFVTGSIAFLVHRAVAGGVLLLILWMLLRKHKYGLPIAAAFALTGFYAVHLFAEKLVVLAGYANYLDWEQYSNPQTPLKYYFIFAVLILWGLWSRRAPQRSQSDIKSLLILTLLFWPFSYTILFAGRSFQMYSVVLLFTLLHLEVPRSVQLLLLIPYIVELATLCFTSGFYS
jgi:hypothetical protein